MRDGDADGLEVVVAEARVERHHPRAVREDLNCRVRVGTIDVIGLPLVLDVEGLDLPGPGELPNISSSMPKT